MWNHNNEVKVITFWVQGGRDFEANFTCMVLLQTWDNLTLIDTYQTNSTKLKPDLVQQINTAPQSQ